MFSLPICNNSLYEFSFSDLSPVTVDFLLKFALFTSFSMAAVGPVHTL